MIFRVFVLLIMLIIVWFSVYAFFTNMITFVNLDGYRGCSTCTITPNNPYKFESLSPLSLSLSLSLSFSLSLSQ